VRRIYRIGLGFVILFGPAIAVAGLSLPPIMESWNHDQRDIRAMLEGARPYDEARVRRDLEGFIGSAFLLLRNVNGGTAEAKDFRARFAGFASDSRALLGEVGQRSAIEAGFSRVIGDCQSCHSAYN
jgi:cytochrome c556